MTKKKEKEIENFKELIEEYRIYDHITVDYDKFFCDIDAYCVTVQDTNGNSYQIKKSTYKNKILQIDKAINLILKIDKDKMCYDMYKAICLLINERDNLICNSAFGCYKNKIAHRHQQEIMCRNISELYESKDTLEDGCVVLETETGKIYYIINGLVEKIS